MARVLLAGTRRIPRTQRYTIMQWTCPCDPRVHVRAAAPTSVVDACPSPLAAAFGSAENRRPMPKR